MPLRALREHPERAALLTDFDGTLSEIVADASTAHPVPIDKGTAVRELAADFDPVAFLGVVSSAEVPEELLVEADDVVAGPAAMTALLAGLAEA